MRVPHYAMRSLAAIGLISLMSGCGGGDSTAPDAPFDPAGTTSDLGAIEASFESEAMHGFQSAAPAISTALGESAAAVALRAAPSKLIADGKPGVRNYTGTVASLYSQPTVGMRPAAPRAAILEEHLGVTFTRSPETLQYGVSDRTGAPSNGVRFIVYAVDPISGQPVSPLAEVGYADIEVSGSNTSPSVRIELVSGNVTYLDYTVGAAYTQTSATLTVLGFVSNSQDRVNFDVDIRVTENAFTFDYTLTVPTRGNFRMELEETLNLATESITSRLELRGPHGTVTIAGSLSEAGGSYEVEVNGDAFATITLTPSSAQPVITGADGDPLTAEELEALEEVYLLFLSGFDLFLDLPIPMA